VREGRHILLVAGAVVVAIVAVWWIVSNTVSCEETCTYITRRFEPEHVEVWTTYHCASRDKDGNCSINIPVTHSRNVPDAWYATFADCKGAFHENAVDERMYQEPPARVTHAPPLEGMPMSVSPSSLHRVVLLPRWSYGLGFISKALLDADTYSNERWKARPPCHGSFSRFLPAGEPPRDVALARRVWDGFPVATEAP